MKSVSVVLLIVAIAGATAAAVSDTKLLAKLSALRRHNANSKSNANALVPKEMAKADADTDANANVDVSAGATLFDAGMAWGSVGVGVGRTRTVINTAWTNELNAIASVNPFGFSLDGDGRVTSATFTPVYVQHARVGANFIRQGVTHLGPNILKAVPVAGHIVPHAQCGARPNWCDFNLLNFFPQHPISNGGGSSWGHMESLALDLVQFGGACAQTQTTVTFDFSSLAANVYAPNGGDYSLQLPHSCWRALRDSITNAFGNKGGFKPGGGVLTATYAIGLLEAGRASAATSVAYTADTNGHHTITRAWTNDAAYDPFTLINQIQQLTNIWAKSTTRVAIVNAWQTSAVYGMV